MFALAEGRFYYTRDGRLCGPMRRAVPYFERDPDGTLYGGTWTGSGRPEFANEHWRGDGGYSIWGPSEGEPRDLVAERGQFAEFGELSI
jgi:hypothetical protein